MYRFLDTDVKIEVHVFYGDCRFYRNVYRIYLQYVTVPVGLAVFGLYVCSNGASIGSNFWLGEWSQDSSFPARANNTGLRNMRIGVYGAIGALQGKFRTICLDVFMSIFFTSVCLSACLFVYLPVLLSLLRLCMHFALY